jgi:hypothetical protein
MLPGRPFSLTARNLLMPSNYQRSAALSGSMNGHWRLCGSYPCSIRLRTALAPQSVTLLAAMRLLRFTRYSAVAITGSPRRRKSLSISVPI